MTARLALTPDPAALPDLRDRFWQLCFGEMNLIELRHITARHSGDVTDLGVSPVESAVGRFGSALGKSGLVPERAKLCGLADGPGEACAGLLETAAPARLSCP